MYPVHPAFIVAKEFVATACKAAASQLSSCERMAGPEPLSAPELLSAPESFETDSIQIKQSSWRFLMATPVQLLDAGALLAPTVKLKDNDGVDTVSARSYQHPALAEPIVRLTPDNLATGDDLMMEYLGFGEASVTGPVAKQRRQALGFPGWALVHDPDHARYALELVKEFRKEIRRANSKPGHAWVGLMEIAKRLGKSVAHFLPSFWEQTGREFIGFGNATYASRAFGKAREAESVHGLKIDENLRQDSFLEFALAGCVSAKALTQYGKDLAAAHEPTEAWEFMKNLTVRRTLGGLPPWTNVCKDLTPLIKAADRDPKQELPSLLELMLDSPAMNRAAMGFWKSASPFIKSLAADQPRVAGVLLNLIPKTSSWHAAPIWEWLEYLQQWDILDHAWKTDVPEGAGPKDSPAAWFHRCLEANSNCTKITFDVLKKMADRLIADGTPLNLYTTYRWGRKHQEVDLNLLDLALSLKIPVADPSPNLQINLSQWASSADDESDSDLPRDPVFVKNDKRFTQKLVDAVEPVAGDNGFEKAAVGKEALRDAREAWLLKTLDQLCGGGMPDFDERQSSLVLKTTATTFQEFPKAAAKLKKLDPLPALINTLKTFVPAEYAWPRLEEVYDSFQGPHTLTDEVIRPKSRPLVCGSFPDAVVSDGVKAVVVRGDEIVGEYEVNLPKGKKLLGLQYLDGDLKVVVKDDYQAAHFWNSKPKKRETKWGSDKHRLSQYVYHLESGGTFTGSHTIHAGDIKHIADTDASHFSFDGETFWTHGWDSSYSNFEVRECDPVSGEKGRKSLPAFLENFAKTGWKLDTRASQLHHYGDLVKDSPLGSKDGLVGFCIRHPATDDPDDEGQQPFEFESVDGRTFQSADGKVTPNGMLQQPGTKKLLPVTIEEAYRGIEAEIFDPDAAFRSVRYTDGADVYIQGLVAAFPEAFWHVLKVRDLDTSKQLRKITRKQVQALVDAATKDVAAGPKKRKPGEALSVPALNQAIRATFPKLTDSRLQEGIRAIVLRYERRNRELLKQIQKRDPKKAPQAKSVNVSDQAIIQTVKKAGQHIYSYRVKDLASGIIQVSEFFAGEIDDVRVSPDTATALLTLLKNLPEKMLSLYWAQEDENDQAWRECYDVIVQSGACDLPGRYRTFDLNHSAQLPFPVPGDDDVEDDEEDDDDDKMAFSWIDGDSRFLISKDWRSWSLVEYSPTGKLSKHANLSEYECEEVETLWSTNRLKSFLEESKQHPHAFPAIDFIQETAEQMGLSVAEVCLIWFGYPELNSYSANFMPKHLRTAMKLKTKEAAAARESLKMMEDEDRSSLILAAMNGEPGDLWQDPPTAFRDRLVAAFRESQPDVSVIPTELSETFSKVMGYGINAGELMKALASPADHPYFSAKAKWKFELKGNNVVLTSNVEGATHDTDVLMMAALCVAWLPYTLPVGHPSLTSLPQLHSALLKYLNNPELLLELRSSYLYDLDQPGECEQLMTAVFAKPKRQRKMLISDVGSMVAVLDGSTMERAVRPSRLSKAADYARVQQQMDASATKEYQERCQPLQVIQQLRSSGMAAIVERMSKTRVPEGQYEANPLLSNPALVKKVMKACNLSDDGAAYYLQLLCLPNPTDKNVKIWNGWTPATLKKVVAELLDSEKVIEAKRPRAGRKVFLPGGWEALKAPHLPLETWKLPLFEMHRDEYDRATPVLPLIVPLQPVHSLFAAGWKRVTTGDEPRYEEV